MTRLVSMTEMLNKALQGKYAVGQFNINNLEWTQAILNGSSRRKISSNFRSFRRSS